MKNLLLVLSVGLFACGTVAEKAESKDSFSAEQTMETNASYESYGQKIDADKALHVSELNTVLQNKDTVQIKLAAVINETCTKKGCWMTVDIESGEEMMVRFKDYEFFVPTEGQSGKTAIFSGKAFRDTVSVEMLQHYAVDAGKTKKEIEQIIEPEITIAFIADGVIIKQ